MTDTVNVPREPTGHMKMKMAFNLSAEFGPEFVKANEAFAMAVIDEFIASAPKAETFDELKPNDIAHIIEQNAEYDENGLYNASQLAEKIYRAFRERAQPEAPKVEQEPVAWRRKGETNEYWTLFDNAKDAAYHIENGTMTVEPLYTHPDPSSDELLEALKRESWDLRCFNIPTGGDDFDIGWRVVGHWQAEPCERVIAEVYEDDPAAAVRAALAKHKGPQS